MLIHGTLCLSEIGGISDYPGSLCRIDAAHQFARHRSAVIVDHHELHVSHQFGIINQRIHQRICQRQQNQEYQHSGIAFHEPEFLNQRMIILSEEFLHKSTC